MVGNITEYNLGTRGEHMKEMENAKMTCGLLVCFSI